MGGVAFSRIGGFESPKAFPVAVIVMTLGSLVGFPLPFVTSITLQFIMLWIQFFCGGFCMPALMAILINSVPQSAQTTASSFATFTYNLLGYLPAPYVYGLVYDLTGG